MRPWCQSGPMRVLLVSMLVLLAGARTLQARLGETEGELVQRFGPVESRQPEQVVEHEQTFFLGESLHFVAGGWSVTALMIDNRCERIVYQRAATWTNDQFSVLLAANDAGERWHEVRNRTPRTQRRWRRDDGVSATWNPFSGFTVSSPVYEKTRAEIRQAARRTSAKLASS